MNTIMKYILFLSITALISSVYQSAVLYQNPADRVDFMDERTVELFQKADFEQDIDTDTVQGENIETPEANVDTRQISKSFWSLLVKNFFWVSNPIEPNDDLSKYVFWILMIIQNVLRMLIFAEVFQWGVLKFASNAR